MCACSGETKATGRLRQEKSNMGQITRKQRFGSLRESMSLFPAFQRNTTSSRRDDTQPSRDALHPLLVSAFSPLWRCLDEQLTL